MNRFRSIAFILFFLCAIAGLTTGNNGAYAQSTSGIIAGSVVDSSTGLGIPNATVTTNAAGYTATTDATGNFAIFNVTPGLYEITASATGYTSATVTAEVVGGETPTIVTIPLSPGSTGGTIFGFTNDINDDAMPGVTVTIEGTDFFDSTITDEDGYYEFTNLAAGDYTLTYELEGYQTQTQYVSIGEGGEVEMDNIVMEVITKGYISGNVVDLKGNAVFAATVTIKKLKSTYKNKYVTDEDGFFEFTDLEAGTYVIIAKKKGYTRAKQTVKLGDGEETSIELTIKKTK
jgi:uncharacterized membrane protein